MTTIHAQPALTTGQPRRTRLRHLVVFLLLAYGLSWWPLLGRTVNTDSAAMIPIGLSIAALVVIVGRRRRPAIGREAPHRTGDQPAGARPGLEARASSVSGGCRRATRRSRRPPWQRRRSARSRCPG
jgi:hypothetical protein